MIDHQNIQFVFPSVTGFPVSATIVLVGAVATVYTFLVSIVVNAYETKDGLIISYILTNILATVTVYSTKSIRAYESN